MSDSKMKKCVCGSKLQVICPICGKRSGFWIEKEEDFKTGSKGWHKVPCPKSWGKNLDPYFTCSLAHMQRLEQLLAGAK
jgi:hypothetical protein